MEYSIDAKNKRMGRVATEAAVLLMGKRLPSYRRNIAPDVTVRIENANGLLIDERKQTAKLYTHYTGYPGGLKQERLEELIAKKGIKEALTKAISGMLPKNKLRKRMLARLVIE